MNEMPVFYPGCEPLSAATGQRALLRAGVIGVGYLGRFHAQKYAAMSGVRLVAVADVDPARGKAVGEEVGVPWFGDYRDFLDQVDMVTICVPTHSHFRVAETCLNAGIHLLLEKPITTTLEEADLLIDLAQEKGLVLQVGHLKRFHPAVVALKASGLISSPRFIQSQRLAPFKNRSLDVDVVLDLMIHDVDLILNFIPAEVVAVEAVGASVVTKQVDIANARLKFADGCVADLTASRVATEPTRRIRFFQAETYLAINFLTKQVRIRRQGPTIRGEDGQDSFSLDDSCLPILGYDTMEAEVVAFRDAVALGQPPLVSGRDGRKALELVMAIRQAIYHGMGEPTP